MEAAVEAMSKLSQTASVGRRVFLKTCVRFVKIPHDLESGSAVAGDTSDVQFKPAIVHANGAGESAAR